MKFVRNEKSQGMTEYILIIILVAVAVLVIIKTFGKQIVGMLSKPTDKIESITKKETKTEAETETLITIDQKKEYINIAKALFIKYLDGYKSETIPSEKRLLDYRIENIEFSFTKATDKLGWIRSNATKDAFRVQVDYSVKPFKKETDWRAGNGKIGDEWIINKSIGVYIDKKDGEYYITEQGNG